MDSTLLTVDTSARTVVDLTGEISRFCASRGDGLVNVFAPHATAGLALMEVGSGSEQDLDDALRRLLPRDDRYLHRHGERGHGTWQHVVLVDTNADNPRRQVRLSFLSG